MGRRPAGCRNGRQRLADLFVRPGDSVRCQQRATSRCRRQTSRRQSQPDLDPGRSRLMAALRLLLGIDYGTKQIGVAVGQAITGQARELCTLKAQNGVPDWDKVQALITEWKPDAIVVGLPLNMDGTPSEMSARAEKFSRRLNGRFGVTVYTHDERLTTFEAKGERMARGGQKGSYRDNPVDAIAAALLLQGWLDEHPELLNV
ncbi:putative Holliday junction resolvase [Pseudomonas syringae pv. coriandricola]|uniref:Putative pre-16S rRNA nuclease n=6 Tax=Pseudomonas syringae group TaxID=136849 RepID=A0A3M3JUM5_9PSED|nr:putative Holliday junction resolvase [Pseudomonas syringae pv. coriandricola]